MFSRIRPVRFKARDANQPMAFQNNTALPSHGEGGEPGNRISSTLRRVRDFRRFATLVSLYVGGTGEDRRLS